MPTCPHCGATVPEGAVYCGNCGATLNATMSSTSTTQSTQSQTWPTTTSSGDMQTRFEKAMKRTENLSYGVAILGVVILALILIIYLLPA